MKTVDTAASAPRKALLPQACTAAYAKTRAKKDLALIYSQDRACRCGGVYHQSGQRRAPHRDQGQHLPDGMAQAIICNSGNANTCNADGVEKAEAMCA